MPIMPTTLQKPPHPVRVPVRFCVVAALFFCGCAASSHAQYTYEKRLLAEAESKFEDKRYPEALKLYEELANSPAYAETDAARVALYRIGYINIYYDNPKANPKASLEAFNSFKARYPEDKYTGEVNTIVKILVVLKSFEDQYDATTARMKKLQNKTAIESGSLDTLLETIQRCSAERDSLDLERAMMVKKIVELEQTIVKMEKTR
ncbi:MAG TPA: hypothetical protein VLX68_16860 [Chitinivibrionales bacterium]|nr:hypothetical protein [Chitinivibrionales bacterium]